MINIEDRSHRPETAELNKFVQNPLFGRLHDLLTSEYHAAVCTEYSGDKVLAGWNVKYKKAGRTLCTVYPRKGYFKMLLVVGKSEKQRVELMLPGFSAEFAALYRGTREGMGQRWLVIEFHEDCPAFHDALTVIRIRFERK